MLRKKEVYSFWNAYRTVIVYGSMTLLYCLFTVYLADIMLESQTYRVIETENGTIRIPVNDSHECEHSLETKINKTWKNSSTCAFNNSLSNISKQGKKYNHQENTNKTQPVPISNSRRKI